MRVSFCQAIESRKLVKLVKLRNIFDVLYPSEHEGLLNEKNIYVIWNQVMV